METYFTAESLAAFLGCNYDHLYYYHYSFGKWIRNNILLEGKLLKMFQQFGITQKDDCSDFLISLFYIDQHIKLFNTSSDKTK